MQMTRKGPMKNDGFPRTAAEKLYSDHVGILMMEGFIALPTLLRHYPFFWGSRISVVETVTASA